jgi:DNA processing protein
MIDPKEFAARIRLARTLGIGPITYRQLLARFGSAARALDALPDLAARGGGRALMGAPAKLIAEEIAAVEALGGHHLVLGVAPYPQLLAHIEDAPPVMTALGHVMLFDRPVVAIVGARNASAAGQRFARQLALELAEAGLVVASGLARGIDGAAHQGALEGGTIACVAGGLDVVYPPEHQDLQERIARQGLLIAENPPGTVPLARHFPRRNRIISGLASGVVVVEAAPKSGSLITARMAADQGREVMAVPGSPLDPRAQGCNQLIRDGATLVQSAADVLEAIRPIMLSGREPDTRYGQAPDLAAADADDAAREQISGLLSGSPVQVDEIIRLSALPAATVMLVLLELDLGGRLDRHAGNRVSLRLM